MTDAAAGTTTPVTATAATTAANTPPAGAAPAPAPAAVRASVPRRHTVLVVDDEPDVVRSVKDLLRLDYRVLGATSAAEGMQVLRDEEVHIVMTDQRMPETTGVEFLSHVRGEHPEAIRLLFTGYADIRAVIDAINQGSVYRYITKPWDPDELQSIIREATQRFDLLVERKKLLEILQQQNKELERTNVELRRSNELKHGFIQVASHELRTPLTILIGLTRLLGITPNLPEPAKDWVRRIDSAAKRLQRLVDQIITLLVANRFDQRLDRKPVAFAPLVRQAADDVRPFVQIRNQTLNVDVPDDLGTIAIEEDRIRDSINHLLLNAIKFTADGGQVTLSASRTAGTDGDAVVRVTDTGCGIDSACQARLFEPFFTGYDVSHHSSGHYEHGRKGLGLGLSVVKAFVEMHGGRIDVDSQPDRGTTFTLTLPSSRSPDDDARPSEATTTGTAR